MIAAHGGEVLAGKCRGHLQQHLSIVIARRLPYRKLNFVSNVRYKHEQFVSGGGNVFSLERTFELIALHGSRFSTHGHDSDRNHRPQNDLFKHIAQMNVS